MGKKRQNTPPKQESGYAMHIHFIVLVYLKILHLETKILDKTRVSWSSNVELAADSSWSTSSLVHDYSNNNVEIIVINTVVTLILFVIFFCHKNYVEPTWCSLHNFYTRFSFYSLFLSPCVHNYVFILFLWIGGSNKISSSSSNISIMKMNMLNDR